MTNAVVLLSGGLDSATCLAMASAEGLRCHALTLQYGQRHQAELAAARAVAASLSVVEHRVLEFDLRGFGGSALTDEQIPVPAARPPAELRTAVPVTYVPARNTIMLALAMAWAELLPADDIYIGVGAVDYSGYPDCRPAFIEAFERAANYGGARWAEGARRLRIHAPLIAMPKHEVIRRGMALGLDYGLTHSCYAPAVDGAACGICEACALRRQAFVEAQVADPTRYATPRED